MCTKLGCLVSIAAVPSLNQVASSNIHSWVLYLRTQLVTAIYSTQSGHNVNYLQYTIIYNINYLQYTNINYLQYIIGHIVNY